MGEELPVSASSRWGPVVAYFPTQVGMVRPSINVRAAITYLLHEAGDAAWAVLWDIANERRVAKARKKRRNAQARRVDMSPLRGNWL